MFLRWICRRRNGTYLNAMVKDMFRIFLKVILSVKKEE
jgi:hypothetical protein